MGYFVLLNHYSMYHFRNTKTAKIWCVCFSFLVLGAIYVPVSVPVPGFSRSRLSDCLLSPWTAFPRISAVLCTATQFFVKEPCFTSFIIALCFLNCINSYSMEWSMKNNFLYVSTIRKIRDMVILRVKLKIIFIKLV